MSSLLFTRVPVYKENYTIAKCKFIYGLLNQFPGRGVVVINVTIRTIQPGSNTVRDA